MPEYPEVVTVKKVLNEQIKNKKIKDIEVLFSKILKNVTVEDFQNKLKGQEILGIDNYGKYLILKTSNYDLLIHLRMEGKLFYYSQKVPLKKHDHIIFNFEDNSTLIYNDVRKFGTFDLFKKKEYPNSSKIKKLGKEPLDKHLDVKYLKEKLNNNKKIKQNLLEQTTINGLGNIYVDEILYASKIHPESLSKNLTDQNLENIITEMQKIIKKAIQNNGTTIKSFSASDQIKGNYQEYLKVYKRKGQKCTICQSNIEKTKIAGRGSHFCPNCQRKT